MFIWVYLDYELIIENINFYLDNELDLRLVVSYKVMEYRQEMLLQHLLSSMSACIICYMGERRYFIWRSIFGLLIYYDRLQNKNYYCEGDQMS